MSGASRSTPFRPPRPAQWGEGSAPNPPRLDDLSPPGSPDFSRDLILNNPDGSRGYRGEGIANPFRGGTSRSLCTVHSSKPPEPEPDRLCTVHSPLRCTLSGESASAWRA